MQRLRNGCIAAVVAVGLFLTLQMVAAVEPPLTSPLQDRYDAAEAKADELLQAHRQLLSANVKDEAEIGLSKKKAHAAVSDALRLEMQLRAHRIEVARLRLDAVEAKLTHSLKVIDQLASNRLNSRLAEITASAQSQYATPQAVLDQMAVCSQKGDFEGLVDLLTDEATADFAGAMLMSTASSSVVRQIAGSSGGGIDSASDQAMTELEELLKGAMRDDAPPAAIAAYSQLTSVFLSVLLSQNVPEVMPDRRKMLRTSAGVLKDQRKFIVAACQAIEKTSGTSTMMLQDDGAPMKWKISSDGDVAIAEAVAGASPNHGLARLELRRDENGWKISKLFSDETLQAIAAGPKVTVHSPSASPAPTPAYRGSPSPYAPTPVSPTPVAPNPVAPNPVAPIPVAPNPVAPNPVAPNPVAPNPAAPGLYAPNPYAPNPYAPDKVAPGPDGDSSTQNLSYPTPLPSLPIPVYSGHPIEWWLDQYWTLLNSGQRADHARDALAAFCEQPSSDMAILQAMGRWFVTIENELDPDRLRMIAESIVAIAGHRHQHAAVEYLFKIAEQYPISSEERTPIHWVSEQYFLHSALKGLKRWDEKLADQLAGKLQSGTSRQRELALAMYFTSDQLDKDRPTPADEPWVTKNQAALTPAMLAATHDADPIVRVHAIYCLAQTRADSPDVLARLTTVVDSDPSFDVQSASLSVLAYVNPDNEFLHDKLLQWARSDSSKFVAHALKVIHDYAPRKQSIDELAELLNDPKWGLDRKVRKKASGQMHEFARPYAIASLGDYGAQAYHVLPALQAELARQIEETASITKTAIDDIAGFNADLPIAEIQGQWALISASKPDDQDYFLAGVSPSPDSSAELVVIDGTKIMKGKRLLAQISGVGGDGSVLVRLLADPNGSRLHCTGKYKLSDGTLKLELSTRTANVNTKVNAGKERPQTYTLRRPQE